MVVIRVVLLQIITLKALVPLSALCYKLPDYEPNELKGDPL